MEWNIIIASIFWELSSRVLSKIVTCEIDLIFRIYLDELIVLFPTHSHMSPSHDLD